MAFRRSRATALDRDPIDQDKLDGLMLFLKGRLDPDDFAKFVNLIDDIQDDAEEANPSAEMANDALPASMRRIVRRGARDVRLGFDSGSQGLAQDGAHSRSFEERFPDAARIKSDTTQDWEMRYPRQVHGRAPVRVALDAAAAKSLEERFPGVGRIRKAD